MKEKLGHSKISKVAKLDQIGMRSRKLENCFCAHYWVLYNLVATLQKKTQRAIFLLIKTSLLILRSLDILLQNVMSTEIDYMVFCQKFQCSVSVLCEGQHVIRYMHPQKHFQTHHSDIQVNFNQTVLTLCFLLFQC